MRLGSFLLVFFWGLFLISLIFLGISSMKLNHSIQNLMEKLNLYLRLLQKREE